MADMYMKNALHHLSLGKCRSKQQYHFIPLSQAYIIKNKTTNADMIVGKRNSHSLLVRMLTSQSFLENNMDSFKKKPRNWSFPLIQKFLFLASTPVAKNLQKIHLYFYAHRSIIHKSKFGNDLDVQGKVTE